MPTCKTAQRHVLQLRLTSLQTLEDTIAVRSLAAVPSSGEGSKRVSVPKVDAQGKALQLLLQPLRRQVGCRRAHSGTAAPKATHYWAFQQHGGLRKPESLWDLQQSEVSESSKAVQWHRPVRLAAVARAARVSALP